ncbi:DUF92 domain-containing protein [Fervidibacillus halotolerans]|uniref:DUF92 domain-containing protein n=1 Tax=Fervidibacillus halotolerans TaxID=2980027 RepID=A0A9E8LXN8_9BACI|nr:DUF92 domain-containing protein [Fervidibacillus halotolerans]WAA11464.1 DUF92 domain-containing protein [Fervidibacillus halotolerans]
MAIDVFIVLGIFFISIVSRSIQALNWSGMVASIFVGLAIWAGLEWKGLVLLGLFFFTSTFWSKWGKNRKQMDLPVIDKEKGRNGAQVFANGFIASLFSLLFALTDHPLLLIGFIVSIASANGDTWASEIGVFSKQKPVILFTAKRVEKGTSGAVSMLGTLAGLAGSFVVSFTALLLWPSIISGKDLFLLTMFGLLGMFVDSVLGVTVQERFRCSKCGNITESRSHCGVKTVQIQGVQGVNNHMVNFLSICFTSILSLLFYQFFG